MSLEHVERASLLSSEFDEPQTNSHQGAAKYRGILNLCFIVLFASNLRLVVENARKYGMLVNVSAFRNIDFTQWPSLSLSLFSTSFIATSLLLEKWCYYVVRAKLQSSLTAKSYRTPKLILLFHGINCLLVLVSPCVVIYYFRPNPAANILSLVLASCTAMKLYSFAFMNCSLRRKWVASVLECSKKKDSNTAVFPEVAPNEYPNSLSVSNMAYFILVPTLTYQPSYPRNARVRKTFLLKRFVEFLLICVLIFVVATQYVLPALANTMEPFDSIDITHLIERVLKLAVPNLYIWLLGFYGIFHVYLNLLAEVLQFADRHFYNDWWNSTTLDYFWRNWNIPVHKWVLVHVYLPAINAGWSSTLAGFLTFFVSALFHEYIVSGAFVTVKGWSFAGMMLQMPAVQLSRKFARDKQLGNVFFWMTILLGQPLIVLFYYAEFRQR